MDMATSDEPQPAPDGPAADKDRIDWFEARDPYELERLVWFWSHAKRGQTLRDVMDRLRREGTGRAGA
jgi:hypothetical protein